MIYKAMQLLRTGPLLLVSLLTMTAHAELDVINLWARATVPSASNGAVYGRLHNPGDQAVVITSLASPIADKIQIHRSTSREGMMGMEHVPRVSIESGQALSLEPGGMHIMLMGLKQPLKQGMTFEIHLASENQTFTEDVIVGDIGQMEPPATH